MPYVRTLTFEFSTTTDLHYAADLFASSKLPDLFIAVAKVEFPNFHWFSGVVHNRRHNPYFQMLVSLPYVEDVALTMHIAGVTTSAFGEREMVRLEAFDPILAQERKVIQLQKLVSSLELEGLFALQQLRHVRLD